MKKVVVEKARKSLEKASKCLELARAAMSFDDFESAWEDFLTAINKVRSALWVGAEESLAGSQWQKSWKKTATEDPLLAYLREARNTQEHSVEAVTAHFPGGVLVEPGGQLRIQIAQDPSRRLGFRLDPVESEGVIRVPSHAKLVSVTDKSGNIIDVPTEHLSVTLGDTSPIAVGAIAIKYYALIDQAKALPR
jgi:hypothetical protein